MPLHLPSRTPRSFSAAGRTGGKGAMALAALLAAAFASPAAAAHEPKTRLVNCAEGSCLLVTGRRASAEAGISINGNAVSVEGDRRWRVMVPLATVRQWAAPFARTLTVSVADPAAPVEAEAELPIGLLGHNQELAFLVVRAK